MNLSGKPLIPKQRVHIGMQETVLTLALTDDFLLVDINTGLYNCFQTGKAYSTTLSLSTPDRHKITDA